MRWFEFLIRLWLRYLCQPRRERYYRSAGGQRGDGAANFTGDCAYGENRALKRP